MRLPFKLILAAGMSVLAASAATTPTFTFAINDLADSVTITDVNQTGRLTNVTCVGESCSFSIISPGSIAVASFQLVFGGNVTTTTSVNFLEPPSTFQVSDILSQTDSNTNTTFWQFTSDSESPLSLGGGFNLTEDGNAQQTFTIQYKNVDSTVIAQDIITVQSDLEGVPEPSTGLIALAGLAGLGILSRRRRTSRPLN